MLRDYFASQVVCLLEHVKKLELDALVADTFEKLQSLLQSIKDRNHVCLVADVNSTDLTKHIVDEAPGALDVITPTLHHHVVVGVQLQQRVLQGLLQKFLRLRARMPRTIIGNESVGFL